MMNLAIFRKTLSDSCSTLLAAALGLTAFVVVFVWAMLNMGTELMEFISKFGFLRRIFEMSLGISLEGEVSVNTLFAVSFTHAVSLTLCWTVVIAAATRVTAGEVERGTADLLLTLPLTRSQIYLSTSLAWWLAALVMSCCPLAGMMVSIPLFRPEEPIELNRYIAPTCNFVCLNLAVGGLAMLVGSLLNRRGPAIAVVVGIALLSAVLNFLEPFLEVVKNIRFLGLLSYFRPVDIARSEIWPWSSMGSLLLLAAFCWIVGLIVFCRKDIPTA